MKYNVTTIPNFEKQYKRLWKKYPSLFEDVNALIESLESNPLQGSSLGNGLYKVRLSVTSKAQGKSGGARVITCVKVTGSLIVLVAIYDKSEQETVSPKELKRELKQAGKELKLVDEGKLTPRPVADFLSEVKASRGGSRLGAGRKSPLQAQYPNEVKKRVTLRLYPTQLKEIEGKYGSLQSAVDGL
jgi:hypothetical protein